jgi:hypothetical protein
MGTGSGGAWALLYDSASRMHAAWTKKGAASVSFKEWAIKDMKKVSINKIDVYHTVIPNMNFFNIAVELHPRSEIENS